MGETAKKKRKMAEAALAKKASDAAKARAEQNKKEAAEVEAQRKRDDATDAEKAKAQKAKRAKELADEFKKGLKAGEKTLDMWKDKAGVSIADAIAHAHREAPHTAQSRADKAKEEKA